ncbi:hypothetical protein NKH77_06315 [Streptomyces sp. M19]
MRLHHIAVDGWSFNVLFRELSADYAAALADGGPREAEDLRGPGGARRGRVPDAEVRTPLDYAHWQADWFTRPGYLAQRASCATTTARRRRSPPRWSRSVPAPGPRADCCGPPWTWCAAPRSTGSAPNWGSPASRCCWARSPGACTG